MKLKSLAIALAAISTSLHMSAQYAPAGDKIKTEWASKIDVENVWNEYPRPIMERADWMNLNGLWDYAIAKKNAVRPSKFDGDILVPFAVESSLSGVGRTLKADEALWYAREFTIPSKWKNKRVLLHFGAVDWQADVWVNNVKVGTHTGGYTPFCFDITSALKSGSNSLEVRVLDSTDAGFQPRGKQVSKPEGIWYTPVSGIWQTVWLEPVADTYISDLKILPDIDSNTLSVDVKKSSCDADIVATVQVKENGEVVAEGRSVNNSRVEVAMPDDVKLWSPDSPFLYDLEVTIAKEGKIIDKVTGYAAMRKYSIAKDRDGIMRFQLNNKFLFHFGTLDQGWWPDGLYTAPSDEALAFDIEKTKQWGFNMIRKHIKVEPARWYYHCDRLGMLVWQDMPSCSGLHPTAWITRNFKNEDTRIMPDDSVYPSDSKYTVIRRSDVDNFRKELKEVVESLYSYPCIVTWVPFNEGWGQFDTVNTVKLLRSLDSTRPINAASGGNFFQCGDILSNHNYPAPRVKLFSLDYINAIDEYGGLGVQIENHVWKQAKDNYGYGGLRSVEEAEGLYVKYASILADMAKYGVVSAVYTQTTDVEIEVNGLMTYDRKVVKFNEDKIREANKKVIDSINSVDSIY